MNKKNIQELTGLRGIAALAILLNHVLLICPYLRKTMLFSHLQNMSCVGMSLFFTLSGIVIYYNYADDIVERKGKGIINFFIARFARLYPLYLTFLIVSFIKNLFLPQYNHGASLQANVTSIPIFLAGMQSWFYGYINNIEVIRLQGSANISWSISCEFALYFIFIPISFLLFRFKSAKSAFLIFFICIMLRGGWVYMSFYDKTLQNILNSIFPGHNTAWVWLVYHSPIVRFFEFLSGCAIAIYYKANQPVSKKIKLLGVFFIIAAGIMMTGLHLKKFNFPICGHILISPSMMMLCFATAIFGAKFLQCKMLLFLGEVSYSAYLLHIFIVLFLRYRGSHYDSIIATIAGYFIITYTLSYFSYRYFETPMRRKIRAFFADQKEDSK